MCLALTLDLCYGMRGPLSSAENRALLSLSSGAFLVFGAWCLVFRSWALVFCSLVDHESQVVKMNDLRYAFPLLKIPGFTAVAGLTLALGTGLDAAMTGLVDAQSCTKTAVGSPPFSIQEEDKTAWLVRPNGERLFSLGVCCVNQG